MPDKVDKTVISTSIASGIATTASSHIIVRMPYQKHRKVSCTIAIKLISTVIAIRIVYPYYCTTLTWSPLAFQFVHYIEAFKCSERIQHMLAWIKRSIKSTSHDQIQLPALRYCKWNRSIHISSKIFTASSQCGTI